MHRRMARLGVVAIAGLLLTSVASGYYHYVHFASRFGPFIPMPEKFDLNVLRNKTVYYFISDQGPSQLALIGCNLMHLDIFTFILLKA